MQARIESNQDLNKNSYLQAIADRLVTNPGAPTDWGTKNTTPANFGLAAGTTFTYELDTDKLCRLNSQNNCSLSYAEIANAAKLTNIALKISLSQLMTIDIKQTSNQTYDDRTYFGFKVATSVNSKPSSATLHCYIIAYNYKTNLTDFTTSQGTGEFTVAIPSAAADHALLVVFARASFDDRITAYAVYNFASAIQETCPGNTMLALSPLDYTLSFIENSTLTVDDVYALSFSYQQKVSSLQNSQCPIPRLVDSSPIVLVACGNNHTSYLQEWTAYPQVPLTIGARFNGGEQNVFRYLVTVNGVLYQLDLTFGDVPY
ncbi:MAG: hypothetical protein NWE98_01305 [Candidatus Bathyarchaeota archaeon]|nr:hypothetical protein [Candidatus Bathyarchaeota archaeon]